MDCEREFFTIGGGRANVLFYPDSASKNVAVIAEGSKKF
jgi:hypothetical protein